MTQCIDFFPSEQVRVFISSAQSNENGFAWSAVRQRIKDSLKSCIYLNPFIIENEASVTSSLQFFQRQVEYSDVIVLLVKGEVRAGTATEYSLAAKLEKPLLVYFIDDDNPDLDVLKLKKDIQTTDRCTYHQVSNFDNIEYKIRNDIINNIVRTFQDRYFVSQLNSDSPISTEISEDAVLTSSGVPSKTEIDRFRSCYDYFFELLNLSYTKNGIEQTELHRFGCALLSWLCNGNWDIGDEEIINFISKCSDVYKNTNWLQKRWDAIRFYFRGDLEKALRFEEEALVLAREAKESDWVINNILIDCRNIEVDIGILNHRFVTGSVYQKELSSKKSTVYLPVLDRYLNNINNFIQKDEFRVDTATPYTQLFGSKVSNAITDLANYLFTAAIFGSNTHLLLTRKIFASILSRYSKIQDEPSLTFSSLRQYVLNGNIKEYKLFLNSTWDSQYSYISSKSDDIWNLTGFVPVTHQETMKLSVFATLGLYLSDDVFTEASECILSLSKSISWDSSESYIEALQANLRRMNPEKIIQTLTPIIAEKRFHIGNRLSHIFLYIDLKQVGEKSLQDLAYALNAQLPYIIRNNGDPQMIAPLVERSKVIFGNLETMEGNGLSGIQESLYKINRGSGDWYPVMKHEIDAARNQFSKNSNNGVFYGFASDPYAMISAVVRKEKDNEKLDDLILYEFIPLSIDVLNSEAAVQTKEPCVACICEVLSSFSKRNIELPASIKQALQTVDIKKGTDVLSSSTRKALEIRVLMAQIIAGIVDERELLSWCIEFERLEIREKVVIIDCLEKYLYHKRNDLDSIDSLVVSIVLQCHSAKHRDIRRIAVRCLAYLVASKYHDIANIELNKAAFDSSDTVRNTLLDLCKNKTLPTEISNRLISLLRNDTNYYIRYTANQ